MKLLTINYMDFVIPDNAVGTLAEILTNSTDGSGEPISFSFKEAPDIKREQLKKELLEELRDGLVKEKEQYSSWWLQERGKVAKLEKELAEFKGTANEPL